MSLQSQGYSIDQAISLAKSFSKTSEVWLKWLVVGGGVTLALGSALEFVSTAYGIEEPLCNRSD
jgi:hypothetical protein